MSPICSSVRAPASTHILAHEVISEPVPRPCQCMCAAHSRGGRPPPHAVAASSLFDADIVCVGCTQLLASGGNVVATVRSKGSPAIQGLQAEHGGKLTVVVMDVSDFGSIKVRPSRCSA